MSMEESIICRQTYGDYDDLPVEYLHKALFICQQASELEDVSEILKNKLIDVFKGIPEKGNEKHYKKYHYQKNGVLYYKSITGANKYKVVLKPWGKLNEESDKKTLTYSILKDISYSYYCQVRTYLKKTIALSTRQRYSEKPDFSIAESIEKYGNFLKLSDEEKSIISYENLLDSLNNCLEYNMYRLNPINEYSCERVFSKITFLSEEGIKKLIAFYDKLVKEENCSYHYGNYYKYKEILTKFIDELKKEYVIDCGITTDDYIKIEETKYSMKYQNTIYFPLFYDKMLPKLKLAASKDENIEKCLIKMKILKKSKKKAGGVKDGGTTVTTEEEGVIEAEYESV